MAWVRSDWSPFAFPLFPLSTQLGKYREAIRGAFSAAVPCGIIMRIERVDFKYVWPELFALILLSLFDCLIPFEDISL